MNDIDYEPENSADRELQRIDEYEVQKEIDSNWQGVLKYMFKNAPAVSMPHEGFYGEKETEYVKMLSHFFFIMSDIGLLKEYEKDIERKISKGVYQENGVNDDDALKSINHISSQIFEKLVLYGYVVSDDKTVFETTVNYTEYKITEKGIDVALRLQEHDDSEKRHVTVTKISKFSLVFSVIAVALAGFSAYVSNERLKNDKAEITNVVKSVSEPTKKVATKNN